MSPDPEALERLIHDVNSQGSSLVSAAPLLRESSPAETRELLALLVRQAEGLALRLSEFERSLAE